MQNKLQELTDKLYNEGLSKGKQEGDAYLADAKAKAEAIIAEANEKAAAIIKAAEKDAKDLKTKVEGDLKMAANQSIEATKQDIEHLIVSKMVGTDIKNALGSADFVKEIITAVAKAFNAQEAIDLELVLPETLKKDLEPFIKNELAKVLKGGIDSQFSKKVSGGFTIAPKDGAYFISFTEETFMELISEYLRPATKKILFG